MATLTKLKTQRHRLQCKIDDIEAERARKEHEKLVGRCYKYRNSYGSGEKWWLYAKVTAAGDIQPLATTFEQTANGSIEIRREWGISLHHGWEEISMAECLDTWNRLNDQIVRLHP